MDIKVSYKVIPSLLMGIIRDSQNNKFSISVQYVKKKIMDGVHFYKLAFSFLMEVARHVQSTHNRKLVMFLQYLQKKLATAFVIYCEAKHSDILLGPVMFVLTYS